MRCAKWTKSDFEPVQVLVRDLQLSVIRHCHPQEKPIANGCKQSESALIVDRFLHFFLTVSHFPLLVLITTLCSRGRNADGVLVYHGGLDSNPSYRSLEVAILSLLLKAPSTIDDVKSQGISIDARLPRISRQDRFGKSVFSSEMLFDSTPDAIAFHCSTMVKRN
ncbi:MAG: hypothetical protein FJ267_04230, partial [Planctomycetes bacterium]|nr:hypothetical protein [Planctomycetota bacterium]